MAGKPGMHKKTTETTLPPPAPRPSKMEVVAGHLVSESQIQAEQEEKLLKDLMEDYSYWRKQPGEFAKTCAAAFRTLLNEFTAEETKE